MATNVEFNQDMQDGRVELENLNNLDGFKLPNESDVYMKVYSEVDDVFVIKLNPGRNDKNGDNSVTVFESNDKVIPINLKIYVEN